ncbi:formimidoylglutamase [Pseudoxanthomonas sp. F37]|uniref:formimidoylglutamase n=1 Tax=Pseudoxanthomonas TaxID=83618 RepID=UPI001FD1F406|nr:MULTISPECIES: formimidoylglutamase [Pseudoxanthomonas]UOV05538.1 formimidoylglutamase [Pseudoxanthomonas mexicana]UOV07095.1 formimidoylglutamase [Pseudoxanthomonas sp. F37]
MNSVWQGCVDMPAAADTRRWHQEVRLDPALGPAGIALLGFACDEGIRRNAGRTGAAQGPDALRKAMSNLPVRHAGPLYDAGDIRCVDQKLESAQALYSQRAQQLLDQGHWVVGLGGGHEIGYASYAALRAHLGASQARIGIFNFDAHFDLRNQGYASSGTPFLQALEHARSSGYPLHYHCIGISRSSNTPSLFATAEREGTRYITDDALCAWNWHTQADLLVRWCEAVDVIYLTLCLDVLPQSIAPGVSAPNPRGISLEVVECLLDLVVASGKVRLMDVAELCPPLDPDQATARVAARLIHRVIDAQTRPGQKTSVPA